MKQSRINRVIANMQQKGFTQILVTSSPSVYYLTGVWVEPGERMLAMLIQDDGTVTLYGYKLFALNGVVDVPLVEYDDIDDCVAILAESVRPGTIGIDRTWPSHFTLRLMAARSDVRPMLGSLPVDEVRMVKDAEELANMRAASKLNDAALKRTIDSLQLGMTEKEVGDLYIQNAKSLGSDVREFGSLICFGPNCAEPHHTNDDTVLKTGDAVICDVGAFVNGYCSDMTRTVFMGAATDEQKRVYEIVEKANAAGRAAVRPGLPMKAFDLAARKVIEDAGYGKYFIHRTGHNIGVEVHEYPDVNSTCEVLARPGMVFSIEPGIYLPGKFGVRVEDLVVVTEDGGETLNSLTKDFRII